MSKEPAKVYDVWNSKVTYKECGMTYELGHIARYDYGFAFKPSSSWLLIDDLGYITRVLKDYKDPLEEGE